MKFLVGVNAKARIGDSGDFMICKIDVAVNEKELAELLSYDVMPLSLEDGLVEETKYSSRYKVDPAVRTAALQSIVNTKGLGKGRISDTISVPGYCLVVKSYAEVKKYYPLPNTLLDELERTGSDEPPIYAYLKDVGIINKHLAAQIKDKALPELSEEQMWEMLVHLIGDENSLTFIYEKYKDYIEKYHSSSRLLEMPYHIMDEAEYNDKFEDLKVSFLGDMVLAAHKAAPSTKTAYAYPVRKAPFLFKIASSNYEYDKFVEWTSPGNVTLYPEGKDMKAKELPFDPSVKAEFDRMNKDNGGGNQSAQTERLLEIENVSNYYLRNRGISVVIGVASIPPGLRFIMNELPMTTEVLTNIAKDNDISGTSSLKKHELLERIVEELPEFESPLVGYVNTSPDAFDTFAPEISDMDNLRLRLRYVSRTTQRSSDQGGVVSGFLRPLTERISLEHSYGSQLLSVIPSWDSEENIAPSVYLK